MLKIGLLLKKFLNFTGKYLEKSRFKNAKFSGYWFYMNTNLQGDFQICICVPLNYKIKLIKSIIICILMNHLKVLLQLDSNQPLYNSDNSTVTKNGQKYRTLKINLLNFSFLGY